MNLLLVLPVTIVQLAQLHLTQLQPHCVQKVTDAREGTQPVFHANQGNIKIQLDRLIVRRPLLVIILVHQPLRITLRSFVQLVHTVHLVPIHRPNICVRLVHILLILVNLSSPNVLHVIQVIIVIYMV